MRFIQKLDALECFKNLSFQPSTKWKRFKNPCKLEVKEQILKQEQKGLCAYCEVKISDLESCHIEHIKPKATFEDDKFTYANFVVSCNGKECHILEDLDEDIHSCGHRKDNSYDSSKFLDPTLEQDIQSFFQYDTDDGKILPSEDDTKQEQARYMIELLHLDNYSLNKQRKNAVVALENSIRQLRLNPKEVIKNLYVEHTTLNGFISFLQYYYKKVA